MTAPEMCEEIPHPVTLLSNIYSTILPSKQPRCSLMTSTWNIPMFTANQPCFPVNFNSVSWAQVCLLLHPDWRQTPVCLAWGYCWNGWKEKRLGPTIKTSDYIPFFYFSLPFSLSGLSMCNSPISNKTLKNSSIATYVIYCTFLITP